MNWDVLMSRASGVMLILGVGINLRPRPRMWCGVWKSVSGSKVVKSKFSYGRKVSGRVSECCQEGGRHLDGLFE